MYTKNNNRSERIFAEVLFLSVLTVSSCGGRFITRDTRKTPKMHVRPLVAIPVCVFAVFVFWITGSSGLFIPNLTERCYRCLCHVSTKCDMNHACTGGYCGPFNISKIYWVDAGKVVMPDDDPQRNHAWEDCARSYHCAKGIIEGYLQKFGQDCNGDGVTNCYDYMMVNGNGGYGCTAPLNRSVNGRRWLKRYAECGL